MSPGFNSNLILALNQFEKMPHQWGIGSCFDIGLLDCRHQEVFLVLDELKLAMGFHCIKGFHVISSCSLSVYTFSRMQRVQGLNSNSTICPGNRGNIFGSCMGLSLSSALFTPYFHHLKPPNRRLEHFHPILSGVHHLSTGKSRAPGWYCTGIYVCKYICKYTCIF